MDRVVEHSGSSSALPSELTSAPMDALLPFRCVDCVMLVCVGGGSSSVSYRYRHSGVRVCWWRGAVRRCSAFVRGRRKVTRRRQNAAILCKELEEMKGKEGQCMREGEGCVFLLLFWHLVHLPYHTPLPIFVFNHFRLE